MPTVTPKNVIKFLERLTPEQARTKEIREVLSAAGRACQLNRALVRPMTQGRTILPSNLPLTPHNVALYFESLEKKDVKRPIVRAALSAAGRVFVLLRARSGPAPTKLKMEVLKKIHRLYKAGHTHAEIGAAVGVSARSVGNVVQAGDVKHKPMRAGRPSTTSVILEIAKTPVMRDSLVEMVLPKTSAARQTVESIISQMLRDGRLKRDNNGYLETEET